MVKTVPKGYPRSLLGGFSERFENLALLLFAQKVLYRSYSGIEYGGRGEAEISFGSANRQQELSAIGAASLYYSSSSNFISHEVYFRFLTKPEIAPYHCN